MRLKRHQKGGIIVRVVQMGDLHLGVNYNPPSKFDDINRILDWTADRIIAEKCDLCLIAGDMFKDARVMLDRASQEIASIVRFLRKLADNGIEVLVISGTPSHDAISAYELMREMDLRIGIFTKPEVIEFGGLATEYSIACLPGLNRSALLTQDEYKGLPAEQVHRIMTDKITQLCQGMSAQMPDDKPKILMAHLTYQNAETGFTDLLMQNEPILTREAVAGFDLVCLGHIHRPQQIDGKVFYSGPIERLSFNEQDIKPGFWIHDYEPDLPFDNFASRFIETPARRYVSLNYDFRNSDDIEGVMKWELAGIGDNGVLLMTDIAGAIVRLHYQCTEEQAKIMNRKKIEELLYQGGAFYVAEIKGEVQRTDRARDNTVNENLGPVDALKKWATNQGIEESEITELQSMTESLLGEVE